MNEKQLIHLSRGGDKEAFAKLYGMYKDRLYRYAYYRLADACDAEDAVSETVLTAYREIGSLRKASNLNFPMQFVYWFIIGMFSWIYNRCFIGGLIRFYYNNSARKKIKKGQSFKEWLLYSRFKRIPKFVIVIYLIITFTHLAVWILFPVFRFIEPLKFLSSWIISGTTFIDCIFILHFLLCFGQKMAVSHMSDGLQNNITTRESTKIRKYIPFVMIMHFQIKIFFIK